MGSSMLARGVKTKDYTFEDEIADSPIIDIKGYKYFISALTDGVVPINPHRARAVAEQVRSKIYLHISYLPPGCHHRQKHDYVIVTPEALGIPITVLLSDITGQPYLIVRKRPYYLPDEIEFDQSTGYGCSKMYLNGIKKGDKVVIVDDILSTGGTLKSLILALQSAEAEILCAVVLVNKGDKDQEIQQEFDIPVKYLVKVKIENDKVVVVE